MLDTLTLIEAAKLLHYKDKRSAEKWCINNDVVILSHPEKKIKCIVRQQFYYVFYADFIEQLKKLYKGKWQEAWSIYCNQNITDLEHLKNKMVAKNTMEALVPKTPIEIEFYERLYGKNTAA